MHLTHDYRVFHPSTTQYTFVSAVHGTVSKIYHIFGHKASLDKYMKIEISSYILPDYNKAKLEFNNKRISRKYSNNWMANNMLLHDL
jgi:hypothetical protein